VSLCQAQESSDVGLERMGIMANGGTGDFVDDDERTRKSVNAVGDVKGQGLGPADTVPVRKYTKR